VSVYKGNFYFKTENLTVEISAKYVIYSCWEKVRVKVCCFFY